MESSGSIPFGGDGLRILHVMLTMGETSAPYNEHCLGFRDHRDLSVVTFFEPTVASSGGITLFAGDSSVRGFVRALRAALAAGRYDIVHLHSPHVGFGLLLARLARIAKRLPPTVHTVHSSYSNFKLRNRVMLASCFASSTRVVCCSKASEASFPWHFRLLARGRLCAVANGVDIDRIDRIATRVGERHAETGRFSVTAIGRLFDAEVKNPFCVLRAFELLRDPESRLTYMGEGPLREPLIAESVTLGVSDRADFTGLIPREDVFGRLLDADVFISTSRVEGLPVAVLEAMACRCPVVLSDIPPHREIAEGVGFVPLVDPDDVEGFARELRRLRDSTPQERSSIGDRCRALVEERFSLSRMHLEYGRIYRDLTGAVDEPSRPTSP